MQVSGRQGKSWHAAQPIIPPDLCEKPRSPVNSNVRHNMKRILIAIIGSFVIYTGLFMLCRTTGSGVLSSGPLDWLFNILFMPGAYIADFVNIKSEAATAILCWVVFAPIFGVLVDRVFVSFSAERGKSS
jgi:hypothetical protein